MGFMITAMCLYDHQRDALYYVALSVFLLICFLVYRCYITWNIYDVLIKEKKTLEDFFIGIPKCRQESHYKTILSQLEKIYFDHLAQKEQKQNANKIMIYRWAHQMKTPLSVIKLIGENHKSDCEYKKILKSVKQIQYDLDQVLNMYKLDDIKNDFHVERISLYNISKMCINELKESFILQRVFPKLQVSTEVYVYSDIKWIKFVLYQLLTNAIKYSDKEKYIIVSAVENSKEICLSIQDEGCGIEQDDINRIFDLFFTGKNGRLRGESSGLGLYMVKQILDYLGHSIDVQSIPNEGSRFTIHFYKK